MNSEQNAVKPSEEELALQDEELSNETGVEATELQEMTSSERTQSFHQCLIPSTCLAEKLVVSATNSSNHNHIHKTSNSSATNGASLEIVTTATDYTFPSASGTFSASVQNSSGLEHHNGVGAVGHNHFNNNNINSHKITDNHLSTKLNRSSAAPYTLARSNSATASTPTSESSHQWPVKEDKSTSPSSLSSVLLSLERSGVNIGMLDHLMLNSSSILDGTNNRASNVTSIQVAAKLIEQSIRAKQQLRHSQENFDSTILSSDIIGGLAEQSQHGGLTSGELSANDDVLMTCSSENLNSRAIDTENQFPDTDNHSNISSNPESELNGIISETNRLNSNCFVGVSRSAPNRSTNVNSSASSSATATTSSPISSVPDCNNMSINSIVAGLGLNMVGPNITTSPGGSLDEHDCDEDKVINGDTFSPGDVPDPDAIKMFVGQIPKNLSETQLKTLFEEFGRVFQINVLRDKVTKQSKGCCFVTFYTRKAALDAQNALHNVKTLPGMNHPIQMKPADNENRYERKLFVGMLSKKCNESDVRNMFSRFGHIDECTVLRDIHGQSKGCAFITFASKQCAQSAIKGVHHSITMEGCSSPIVVKFADTQKDKDQKRNQHFQTSMIGNFASPTNSLNPVAPQYFSELLVQEILQQFQQQQQSNNYFSQMNPLGVQGIASLASLASPNPAAALAGLTASHSSTASNDLATLAALANFSGVSANQHSMVLGVQAALAAAMGGNHAALSPTAEYNCSGANSTNGLGSTSNSLASLATGSGLHSGFNAYTNALRSSVASKQAEGPEGANLFIYHLPPEWGDGDLVSMFSNYGNVISAKVFIDKNTNLSKCFGFVSYDNGVSAQLAIQSMNGFQVGMKRLKVQLKRSKDAAKPY